jgi:O-antigen ligase
MHFTGRFDKITDEAVRSSTSRALQYIRVFDKISEAPFFGFGRTRNFTDLLGSAIDNYYFWLTLEVGIFGILIYLSFLYFLVRTAFNQYKKSFKNYYLLPLLISILISVLFQFLMANPANHIFLYIFVGLISVMKVLQNDNKSMYAA